MAKIVPVFKTEVELKLIALKNALSQKRIILNLTYFIYLKSSLVEQAIMHSDLTGTPST